MRILLAHNSLYFPSYGGGDKSNRLLMEALAARGHQVRVVARVETFGAPAHRALLEELIRRGVRPEEKDRTAIQIGLNGVDVRVLSRNPHLRAYFSAQIQEFDPDVILTSTDDPAHLLFDVALRATRARVVYLIRATIAAPFGPDSSMPSAAKTAALGRADGVVAVTESAAEYARKWGGLDAVHTPISLLEPGEHPYLGRFENRFVTMVNPCAVKGISIFLALAERFPETRFAAVPIWGTTASDIAALGRLPNISVFPPFDNFDDLLKDTRVVLVPSLWAEARSRVILEGMSRGIPVIASDVGGLAEAKLGVDYLLPVNPVVRYQAAVDELMVPVADIPEQDVSPWQAVLQRLLTDRAHYEQLSAESRRAALAYAGDLNVLRFEAYLESVVRLPKRRKPEAASAAVPDSQLSPAKRKLLALRLKRIATPPRVRNSFHMWIAEAVVRELDNSDGRAELARRATEIARKETNGADIEILWDGMWVRRVGPHCFPDPGMFEVAEPNWQRWVATAEKYLRDAEDYWFHVYKPRTGDVIVDIGAGRGEDVFAFSRAAGATGRVWALEPHPVSFAALRKFCELNRLRNVTALNYACLDQRAHMEIETLPVWESNFVRSGGPTPASHPVEGATFDSLCAERGIERIDFLKMNIEGAERFALPGCADALRRARFVCIAAHDFRAARGEGEEFRTLAFVRDFLAASGFQLVTRDRDPRYYVPYHVHGFRAESLSV